MEALLAVVVGAMYAGGLYLMLRRAVVKLIIGLAVLSHAANLLIFTAAGLTRDRPPLVPADGTAPVPPFADPLPQALILTSIVISFALLAFTLVLVLQTYRTLGTEDVDDLRGTDA